MKRKRLKQKESKTYFVPSSKAVEGSRNKDNTITLWIGNLDSDVDGSVLLEIFSHYGKVSNCRIIPDNPGSTLLYGFVDIETTRLPNILNDIITVNGETLKVRLATNKPSKHSQKIQRLKDYNEKKMIQRREANKKKKEE